MIHKDSYVKERTKSQERKKVTSRQDIVVVCFQVLKKLQENSINWDIIDNWLVTKSVSFP